MECQMLRFDPNSPIWRQRPRRRELADLASPGVSSCPSWLKPFPQSGWSLPVLVAVSADGRTRRGEATVVGRQWFQRAKAK